MINNCRFGLLKLRAKAISAALRTVALLTTSCLYSTVLSNKGKKWPEILLIILAYNMDSQIEWIINSSTDLQNPGTDRGGCRNEDITCNITISSFKNKVEHASFTTVQKFGV